MRLCLALFLALSSIAFATREVVTPHLRVLYEGPEMEAYAQRVAAEGERALAALAPLFGPEKGPITVRLEASTDIFNAFALLLPHPTVLLRPLFPVEDELSYGAADLLYMLLVHELTHVRQLGYDELPPGTAAWPDIGLVGQGLAPPPSWFVEGVATYLESVSTAGGRLQDPRTRGLLQSLALFGRWPQLSGAGLATYEPWPGGLTRYLLGAGFVDFLVRGHGWEAVLATLRAYNAAGPLATFAGAWRQAAGTSLFDEWAAWRAELRAGARARLAGTQGGNRLTDSGHGTGAPALSPGGARLAWVSWPPAIVVARLGKNGELRDKRTVLEHRAPARLAWLDADTLVYSRPVPRPGSTYAELFALDVATGKERQLTRGARAHLPAATPGGCVLYIRDVLGEGSSLRRWCAGQTSTLARAPEGAHFVGLAVSPGGRIAVSLWRGGAVDLALVAEGELEPLTDDPAPDLDPAWWGEGRLVFRSAREAGGVFDLWALDLDNREPARLSRTPGGAFEPVAAGGALVYVELGAEGYDLALLERPLELPARPEGAPRDGETPDPCASRPPDLPPRGGGNGGWSGCILPWRRASSPTMLSPYRPERLTSPGGRGKLAGGETRPYDPWPSLLPYGWLPTGGRVGFAPFGIGLEAAVLGEDAAGRHSYALTLGYDSALRGLLGGAYANLRYDYGSGELLGLAGGPEPLAFGLRLGLWPNAAHLAATTETALGASGSLSLRLPLDRWLAAFELQAGVVRLESRAALHANPWQPAGRLDAVLTNQHADAWGYSTRGLRLGLTGVWSATATGPSRGLWAEGDYALPLGPGTMSVGLRAGYRQVPFVPVALGDLAAAARAGYRYSLAVGWRYGDGKLALERLSLTPRLEAWLDGAAGLGADLTVGLDTVLGYGAPVSFTGTAGYAGGFWYGLGLRLPR